MFNKVVSLFLILFSGGPALSAEIVFTLYSNYPLSLSEIQIKNDKKVDNTRDRPSCLTEI